MNTESKEPEIHDVKSILSPIINIYNTGLITYNVLGLNSKFTQSKDAFSFINSLNRDEREKVTKHIMKIPDSNVGTILFKASCVIELCLNKYDIKGMGPHFQGIFKGCKGDMSRFISVTGGLDGDIVRWATNNLTQDMLKTRFSDSRSGTTFRSDFAVQNPPRIAQPTPVRSIAQLESLFGGRPFSPPPPVSSGMIGGHAIRSQSGKGGFTANIASAPARNLAQLESLFGKK